MLNVEEALEHLLTQTTPIQKTLKLDLNSALNKVLAEDIIAPFAVPPADNSMMDGYAVRFEDLKVGTEISVSQRIPAGTVPNALEENTVARIFTGAPLPAGADTVIMQELAEATEVGGVVFTEIPSIGSAIRRKGEDIEQGSCVLQKGQKLRPQDIALIASLGIAEIEVYQSLKLATFTSGDELLKPGQELQAGKIFDSNKPNILLQLEKLGYEVIDLGQVADTLEATQDALKKAAEVADIIITTGGVSVGEEDHLKPAVESLGSLDMWQVKMRPGKPLAYGRVQGKHFLGLPGNPVSAFTTFRLFAQPFLAKTQGQTDFMPQTLWVKAGFDWPKPHFRRDYLRARLVNNNQETSAEIYHHQGSGVLTSTVWADGFVIIPEDSTLQKGDKVEYISLNEF